MAPAFDHKTGPIVLTRNLCPFPLAYAGTSCHERLSSRRTCSGVGNGGPYCRSFPTLLIFRARRGAELGVLADPADQRRPGRQVFQDSGIRVAAIHAHDQDAIRRAVPLIEVLSEPPDRLDAVGAEILLPLLPAIGPPFLLRRVLLGLGHRRDVFVGDRMARADPGGSALGSRPETCRKRCARMKFVWNAGESGSRR